MSLNKKECCINDGDFFFAGMGEVYSIIWNPDLNIYEKEEKLR